MCFQMVNCYVTGTGNKGEKLIKGRNRMKCEKRMRARLTLMSLSRQKLDPVRGDEGCEHWYICETTAWQSVGYLAGARGLVLRGSRGVLTHLFISHGYFWPVPIAGRRSDGTTTGPALYRRLSFPKMRKKLTRCLRCPKLSAYFLQKSINKIFPCAKTDWEKMPRVGLGSGPVETTVSSGCRTRPFPPDRPAT